MHHPKEKGGVILFVGYLNEGYPMPPLYCLGASSFLSCGNLLRSCGFGIIGGLRRACLMFSINFFLGIGMRDPPVKNRGVALWDCRGSQDDGLDLDHECGITGPSGYLRP
ncbi:uncharacterized protein ARMOST_22528 [Armillaria ostoyae]|uniref:Uncharacterized protein n=1 Tax=Armillaria ostoyae TaxID=47428 RepID=A0A284SD55_ARMOS|nr:uncharacterized protein ARMOST_22528 [Armillaria ostoyae]